MKKKNNLHPLTLPSKHGVHEKPSAQQNIPAGSEKEPIDPEDPLTGDLDNEQIPWETDEERMLRDESEDPDAPRSL